MPVPSGVMPEFQAKHSLRPRKKRHTSAPKPEGYSVVIRLPKNSNKAFRVSNQVFQDAMLKHYGQKGGKEGCSSKETGSKFEQKSLLDNSSHPTGTEPDS